MTSDDDAIASINRACLQRINTVRQRRVTRETKERECETERNTRQNTRGRRAVVVEQKTDGVVSLGAASTLIRLYAPRRHVSPMIYRRRANGVDYSPFASCFFFLLSLCLFWAGFDFFFFHVTFRREENSIASKTSRTRSLSAGLIYDNGFFFFFFLQTMSKTGHRSLISTRTRDFFFLPRATRLTLL